MATLVSVVCFVVLVVVVLVISAIDNDGSADKYIRVMWPLLLSTIPSVFAAVKAEQASNDIRNGVLKKKVKDALNEHAEESSNGEGEVSSPAVVPVIPKDTPDETDSDLSEYEPERNNDNG